MTETLTLAQEIEELHQYLSVPMRIAGYQELVHMLSASNSLISALEVKLKAARKGLYDVKHSTLLVQAESIATNALAASSLDESLP